MPAPPKAPNASRRTEPPTNNGRLDLGKQTGPYDTEGVRKRVRQWQDGGAAVVSPKSNNDVVVVEYEDEPGNAKEKKGTPKQSPDKSRAQREPSRRDRQTSPVKIPGSAREMDPERQAWIRRKSTPRNELDPDIKLAAAPIKRVVSDAHWRKDRSPPKREETTPKSDPRPYTIKRTSVYTGNDSPTKTSKDDDGIRVTPIKDRYDDGIRVTPIKENFENLSKERVSKSDNESKGSRRRAAHRTTGKTGWEEIKSDRREADRDSSNRRRRLRRGYGSPSASEAENEDASIAQSLAPDDSVSRVGHARRSPEPAAVVASPADNETPLRPTRTTPSGKKSPKTPDVPTPTPPPPKVFGNRIEAWLTDTPNRSNDPFGADDSSVVSKDDRKMSTSRRRSQKSPKDEDISQRRSSRKTGNCTDPEEGSPQERSKGSPGGTDFKTPRKGSLGSIPESARSAYDDETSTYATSSVPATEILPEVEVDKHSPGANLRRMFPSTGKRLSTIASAETLQSIPPAPSEDSEPDTVVPDRTRSAKGGLRRRLTRHDDLMSVLSLPRAESQSIVSARSIRTSRTRLETATFDDLWREFLSDESKYQRELRTLVDGVIPVLLSCVLSKSSSAVAAGLFGRSAASTTAITKPIIDMGVALERLKAHHRRAPKSDSLTLLNWAQGAIRIYNDYLKAWRMGFQDVVVNLAPASTDKSPGWDDGLLRNEDGDLVNGDGERVDVAFLLKRPLVRLKYLAKTFKGVNFLSPSSLAGNMADKYQDLVTEARRRSNEERARLEDEAAASIDATRARDPKSLALLTGVTVDATRCVRARDYFDMELRHSSGQQMDCKIELLYRDDAPDRGTSGDVLVCEISDTGRWLLFPPIRKESISSRPGAGLGEVVVMIRGRHSGGGEWHELLSLHANDEETGPEWVGMLGTDPLPPSIIRQPSFLDSQQRPASRQTMPREIEIPIGERASSPSRSSERPQSDITTSAPEYTRPSSSSGRLQRKPVPGATQTPQKAGSLPNSPLRESVPMQEDRSASPGLRRSKATRHHRGSPPLSPSSSQASMQFPLDNQQRSVPDRPTHAFSRTETQSSLSSYTSQSTLSQSKKDYSVWLPSSTIGSDDSEDDEDADYLPPVTPTRPHIHRRTSSVPTLDPPQSPKLRQTSQPSTPGESREQAPRSPRVQFDRDEWEPISSPAKLEKRRKSGSGPDPEDETRSSPPKESPSPKLKRFSIPSFTPAFLKRHRRSSSPLKHEYEPSIATDSSTASESSYSDDESITSESSDEITRDPKEVVLPDLGPIPQFEKPTPPESIPSLSENTVSPSQSASQAPYRAVPQQVNNASRVVASIFSWSDRGTWDSLHPNECTVFVTPGLVEAFDMSEAAPNESEGSDITSPSTRGVQPLIALEVTPLVPLRRGTALDISIRSPPTANSVIRASNNVMFRSRSPEECEMLYSLINMARINNPTYVALQNARGPFNESTWAAAMDQRNDQVPSSSWFHNPLRRSNTYRSKASRPASVNTDSSVGTMNTAFSALRRFNNGNNLFNIAKSTITSRQGSRSGTSESLSSGSSTPAVFDPSLGTPLGITNAKVRMYYRESQNKWRDMGSARLTIMLPQRPPPGAPVNPRTQGMEKRILVCGKTRGESLLDVTLGESCFERVARTGIAVSVWEDKTGPDAMGGVLSSKARTYMIQHKTERECAYTFGLVGKLRY